jgi:hypothetical protein
MVARMLVLGLVPLLACGRGEGPKTADELRAAIADYEQQKPDATERRIDALFTRLDADIAALRAEVAAKGTAAPGSRAQEQLATLERDRRELQQAWIAARLKRLGTAAGDTLRGLGESLGRGLEDAGRRLRESLEENGGARPPTSAPQR